MTIHKRIFLFFIVCLALAGLACGAAANEPAADTSLAVPTDPAAAEPIIIVATPTLAEEAPAAEDVPILEAPTAQPGAPTMTALVSLNVRTGPGTNYPIVGALNAGQTALIVGRSPDGNWWKVQCPVGGGSECWASARPEYSSSADAGGVPVAAVPPAPTHAVTATTAVAQTTATATATLQGGATATYTPTPSPTQPGDPTATYTSTPPGQATATYTSTPPGQATATSTPPGQATATTTSTPPAQPTATYTYTPSPTSVPIAPFDNDSLQNPAVSQFLSPTGVRQFSYSNDVSFANGDQEDWVEFWFPNNSNSSQTMWITLDCNIIGGTNAQLRVTVYEDQVGTTKTVLCNTGQQQLTVNNTKKQQLRIHFGITNPDIYATYTVQVVGYR